MQMDADTLLLKCRQLIKKIEHAAIINGIGYIEANNWFYALIAATAIAVIGSYVSQAITGKQFLDD